MITGRYSLNLFGEGALTVDTEPQALPVLAGTYNFSSTVCMFVREGDLRLQYLFNLPKNFSRYLSLKAANLWSSRFILYADNN